MKTQTFINSVFAGAFVAHVVWQRNPTFDTITCKVCNVVDEGGTVRISAGTAANGEAGVAWLDKDGKMRISAATNDYGQASVQWDDNEGKMRIAAGIEANGNASVQWFDKEEKMRIFAGMTGDGTVVLPTEDLRTFESPPKP